MDEEREDGCGWRIAGENGQPAFCQRDKGGHDHHKTQSGREFTTSEALEYEKELEHQDYIEELREQLKRALDEASLQLQRAQTRVKALASDQVYDVEFAESNGYIEHAIREAGLFTAAAQAMTAVLLK
jgi:predicted Zn-dependent protease